MICFRRIHLIGSVVVVTMSSAVIVDSCMAQSFWMQSIPAWTSQQMSEPQARAVAPPSKTPQFRRLPATSSGFRLTGEEANITMPVYLTAKQAAGKSRFRLTSVTSVSVTPETGTVSVSFNGVKVKSLPVGPPYSSRAIEFDIPDGMLSAGWNAVGIAAHQRHRVDCSVAATSELWTRIDSANTGVLFAETNSGVADLGDLAGISPRADGAVQINIVLDDKRKLTPQTVERLGRALPRLALMGRFTQTIVGFGGADEAGLDLVLGTTSEIAGTPDIASLARASGPFVGMLAGNATRNPVVVITGATDLDLDGAIDQLTATESLGAPEGLLALTRTTGHPVGADGQSFSFSRVGVADQDVTGRAARATFNVILPSDFLPADYGRVSIDLAGGYAAGLSPDAQVIVAINGRSAGSVRLSAANGDTFRHKRMFLPLSAFQPGLNAVDIRVDAPDASDSACDTASPDVPRTRFWLSGSTRMSFPPLARIGRLPDLAMTASAGFPYARPDGKLTLVVPTPDRATISAALTLLTQMGVAAGRALPFSFALQPPPEANGDVLIVAAARGLDPMRMREAQLDPDSVKQAWSDIVDGSTASAASVVRATVRRRATQGDMPETCIVPLRDIAKASANGTAISRDITGSFGASGFDYRQLLQSRVVAPIKAILNMTERQLPGNFPMNFGGASLLVAQAPREKDANSVLTIVTGASAALLNSSVGCLVGPRVWSRMSGRLSALDASTGEMTVQPAESVHYISSGAFSLRNERLVIAGLFSLSPGLFALIALLLVGPLALTTHFLVRKLGRANG